MDVYKCIRYVFNFPSADWLCFPGHFLSLSATPSGETRTLPRSSSMAAGLEKNGRSRVQAIFSHAAGDNGTLLSFSEGDVITLLVPEARDGWHYGENEKNKMYVWYSFFAILTELREIG